MLCPLTALEEDQARQINILDSCQACVLNADTQNRKLLEDVKNGCYTYILTIPEIALGEAFIVVCSDTVLYPSQRPIL